MLPPIAGFTEFSIALIIDALIASVTSSCLLNMASPIAWLVESVALLKELNAVEVIDVISILSGLLCFYAFPALSMPCFDKKGKENSFYS